MSLWTMKRKLWRAAPIRGLSLDSGPFIYSESRGPDQHILVSTTIFLKKNISKETEKYTYNLTFEHLALTCAARLIA